MPVVAEISVTKFSVAMFLGNLPTLDKSFSNDLLMFTLRPYQQAAVDAVYEYLRTKQGNPCVVLPTAAGKSGIMSQICRDAVVRWNGRVLILAHVKELLEEDGKKWNLTYTATLETTDKQCFYLAAESVELLTQQVLTYFVVLGLYLGKRLEVLSDGASWIGDWVGKLGEIEVEHVLCWYHLRTRIYQSLGALGLAKDKRKLLEREILGHLWRGETAKAVWILWGVRPPSRSDQRRPNRIDELIGYLLRKRRMIANDEERKAQGLWLSSTRVEKWNDSVAVRCKHNGMSWTAKGVLAVILYAAEQKRNKKSHTTL